MTTLIIGGTGFIGRRLIPLLAKQGEASVVMDINP
ncbi:MAG: NAD-dependent epimerase/dehydratase family protein [Stellaceae bacterium]